MIFSRQRSSTRGDREKLGSILFTLVRIPNPKYVLTLAAVLLAGSFAGEPVDVGLVTETSGIGIQTCHEADRALIELVDNGSFVTTNRVLFLRHLSMARGGTNLMRIRTVCQGSTSEVVEVRFTIRRPVSAPQVYKVDLNDVPPMPAGFVPLLPEGEAQTSYAEFRRRVEMGLRRSE
jgi:hypothetical protein